MSTNYKRTKRAISYRTTRIENLQNQIIKELNIFKSDERIIKQILTKNKNTGSITTLKRLNLINQQIKSGKFNLGNRVRKMESFRGLSLKDLKSYDIVALANRSEFYYKNRELIIKYNRDRTPKNLRILKQKYNEHRQENIRKMLEEVF